MQPSLRKLVSLFLVVSSSYVYAQSEAPVAINTESARAAINQFYRDWEKARVSLDTKVYQELLADDFKALVFKQTMTKEEFVKAISTPSPMTRFQADILTVQKQGDLWVAVITEKLEAEVKGSDGKSSKSFSFWVTRDAFRVTDGKWQAVSTEAIGVENWRGGKTPPIPHWG